MAIVPVLFPHISAPLVDADVDFVLSDRLQSASYANMAHISQFGAFVVSGGLGNNGTYTVAQHVSWDPDASVWFLLVAESVAGNSALTPTFTPSIVQLGYPTNEGFTASGPANLRELPAWSGRSRVFDTGPAAEAAFSIRFVWSGAQVRRWNAFRREDLVRGTKYMRIDLPLDDIESGFVPHLLRIPGGATWSTSQVSRDVFAVTMPVVGMEDDGITGFGDPL